MTPIADLFRSGGAGCDIRPVIAADEAFCRSLFFDNRAAQFAPLGLSEQLLHALLDQQFEAQQIGYAGQFPSAEHFIVSHAGVAVGRLIVSLQHSRPVRPDEDPKRSPEDLSVHLIDISISAAARGCGFGSDVIDRLVRTARALGATRVTLTVLQSNEAARRLYERLGFMVTSAGPHVAMVRHLP